MTAHVLTDHEQLARWREQAGRMQATRFIEGTLSGPQQVWQGKHDGPRHHRAVRDRVGPDDDLIQRRLAPEPAGRSRDEMPFGDLRYDEPAAEVDRHLAAGLVQRPGAAVHAPEHLRSPLRPCGPAKVRTHAPP